MEKIVKEDPLYESTAGRFFRRNKMMTQIEIDSANAVIMMADAIEDLAKQMKKQNDLLELLVEAVKEGGSK